MLFATEIAGATCNHNYEPRWKVFEKVWARIDPQKYKRAQDYNPQQSELTVEEQGTLETVVRTAKTHAARADTSTEVSTIIREAADAAIPARVSHALKTELVAAITSESNCAFGAAKEQHAIEVFTHNNHNIPVTGQNNKFYKMWVGVCPRGTRWGVGGRVDGLTDDRVVEVKNRMRRFFNRVPLYEFIQIQVYLQLTGRGEAVLVQHFNGQQQEEVVRKDQIFWDTKLVPQLQDFCSALEAFLTLSVAEHSAWLLGHAKGLRDHTRNELSVQEVEYDLDV